MECPICLGKLQNKLTIQLSCNHTLHYRCFLSYVFSTECHIFISCPLCREMNTNNPKLFETDIKNIQLLCPPQRCCHSTKQGKRCKNNSHIFNYGSCRVHHKNILPKDKYSVFCDYLYWTFETPNSRRTKLYMLDIAKKLLIQNPEIKAIQELQHYFLRYYHYNNKESIVYEPFDIYNYFQLEVPPKEWFHSCEEKKCIL